MLIHMDDLLRHARDNGYAVGGYDVVSLEFLEAIVAACERDAAPAVLSLAESHFPHYDFELLMHAVVAAGRRARVPLAIHLDHATTPESIRRAIALGCNAVMLDGSHLPLEENVRLTAQATTMARACGIPLEAELGYVPGVEGEDAALHPGEVRMTEPDEARRFVEATGADCLAVSIGTVHGRVRGTPQLDFARLAAIRDAVPVPLVIHGGTGLSDVQYRELVSHGMTKLNYYTALSDAAAASICARAAADGASSFTRLLGGVRKAIGAEVSRMNGLLGAAGQANAAIASCRAWQEVIHAIEFNFAEGMDAGQQQAALARGVRELAAIPGVCSVETGRALKPDARYRQLWHIRFASQAVVDSYATHPVHQAYADECFRPSAADRLTIDFLVDKK